MGAEREDAHSYPLRLARRQQDCNPELSVCRIPQPAAQPATSLRTERATRRVTKLWGLYSTHPPIPPTNVGQCYEYFISCKYKGEKGELSVPGPLRHSYVRRATVHAHTIPNLKPEIWTKHCVTPSSISYVSYFISLSSLSLSLLEPDQSSSMYGDFGVMISGRRKARADRSERVH